MGIPHISGSEIVKGMLRDTGRAVNKENVRKFSIALRAQHGPGVFINRAISQATQHQQPGVIISGFRSPTEARVIKEHGGVLVYIEASDKVRYRRVTIRNRPGDPTTEQLFVDLDTSERKASDDDENLEKIKTTADFIVTNESTLDELHRALREIGTSIETARQAHLVRNKNIVAIMHK